MGGACNVHVNGWICNSCFHSQISLKKCYLNLPTPLIKENLNKKWCSENCWRWVKLFKRNRGGDEKNLEWQDETGEEKRTHHGGGGGAREAVCSTAWLTCARALLPRAPPGVWRSLAGCALTAGRQIHLFRHAKWQQDAVRKTGEEVMDAAGEGS